MMVYVVVEHDIESRDEEGAIIGIYKKRNAAAPKGVERVGDRRRRTVQVWEVK